MPRARSRTSLAGQRAALPVLALLIAALLAGGCRTGISLDSRSTDTVTRSIPATQVPAAAEIRIEMFNGDVTVDGASSGGVDATIQRTGVGASDAEAAADRDRIEVTAEAASTGVTIRARYTPNPSSPNNRGASATVHVPPDARVTVETTNGAVHLTGLQGTSHVRTSNGRVELTGAVGGASVETSNGSIDVQGGAGGLQLRTSNSAVTVAGVTQATLDITTSNGAVTVDASLAAGDHRIETSNATITLTLPSGSALGVDASTSNAEVAVRGFQVVASGSPERGRLVGTVGGRAESKVTLRTSNNPITIAAR